MKNMHIRGLLFAALILAMTVLTGCSRKPEAAPDQVAEALFELLFKDDTAPMQEILGGASEEDVRRDFFGGDGGTSVARQIQSEMEALGPVLTEEEARNLYDGIREVLGRLDFSASLVSEEDGRAVVSVQIGYYGMDAVTDVLTEAVGEALNEYGQENLVSDEAYNEFMKLYFNKFVESLGTLTPADGTREVTVEFEIVDVEINGERIAAWMPVDAQKFGTDLTAAALAFGDIKEE